MIGVNNTKMINDFEEFAWPIVYSSQNNYLKEDLKEEKLVTIDQKNKFSSRGIANHSFPKITIKDLGPNFLSKIKNIKYFHKEKEIIDNADNIDDSEDHEDKSIDLEDKFISQNQGDKSTGLKDKTNSPDNTEDTIDHSNKNNIDNSEEPSSKNHLPHYILKVQEGLFYHRITVDFIESEEFKEKDDDDSVCVDYKVYDSEDQLIIDEHHCLGPEDLEFYGRSLNGQTIKDFDQYTERNWPTYMLYGATTIATHTILPLSIPALIAFDWYMT